LRRPGAHTVLFGCVVGAAADILKVAAPGCRDSRIEELPGLSPLSRFAL
jgi:hypothetical protein